MFFFHLMAAARLKNVKHPKFHWKNKDLRVTKQMKERVVLV